MAKLKLLVLHCTATPEGREVSVAQIKEWHLSPPPKGRGWHQVGYADIIHLNGMVENIVKYNKNDEVDPWEITNGVIGWVNRIERHVVYAGGMDKDNRFAKDTRTKEQLLAMTNYIIQTIAEHPNIEVAGHNQFAAKACPSFDTIKWLRGIGIPEQNIYKG